VLQAVEDLLERELNVGKNGSMTARNLVSSGSSAGERQHSSRCRDDQRYVRHDETESEKSASHNPDARQETSDAYAPRSVLVDVSIQSGDGPRPVDWKNGRRDLLRFDEIISVTTQVDGAPYFAKQPALRLPGYSVGEAALYLKAFLALHP
jgi:hypothetical protein